VQQN